MSMNNNAPEQKNQNVNDNIKSKTVFLILETGEKRGVVPFHEAMRVAKEKCLDLVQVSNNTPVVCRLMDYNKVLFEQKKKEKKNESKNKLEIKEIRFTMNISDHDLQTKARQTKDFIKHGCKVKVNVKCKGRELKYSDQGIEICNKFLQMVGADTARYEYEPKYDGTAITTFLIAK